MDIVIPILPCCKAKIKFPYLDTYPAFVKTQPLHYFHTRFLDQANKFIAGLDQKAIRKLFYNIDLAEQTNDLRLFKKLRDEIWEFRVRHGNNQI